MPVADGEYAACRTLPLHNQDAGQSGLQDFESSLADGRSPNCKLPKLTRREGTGAATL